MSFPEKETTNEPEYLEIVDDVRHRNNEYTTSKSLGQQEYETISPKHQHNQSEYEVIRAKNPTEQKQSKIVYILLAVVFVILICMISGGGYLGWWINELSEQVEEQRRMASLAIGPMGPPGKDGMRGEGGPAGPSGPSGMTGEGGPAGPPGQNGFRGEAGPAGQDGMRGETGERGPPGEQGPPGPQGEKGSNQPLVAFFAMRNGHGILTGSSTSETIITFPEVVTNAGGDYNNMNGYFTVPLDGLYSFTFTVQADGSCETLGILGGLLLVDGSERAVTSSSPRSSGTLTTMLQLEAGQKVAVGIQTTAGCLTLMQWGNSFGGFLIQTASKNFL